MTCSQILFIEWKFTMFYGCHVIIWKHEAVKHNWVILTQITSMFTHWERDRDVTLGRLKTETSEIETATLWRSTSCDNNKGANCNRQELVKQRPCHAMPSYSHEPNIHWCSLHTSYTTVAFCRQCEVTFTTRNRELDALTRYHAVLIHLAADV